MSYLEAETRDMKKIVLDHMRKKHPRAKSTLVHELYGGKVIALLIITDLEGFIYKKFVTGFSDFEYVVRTVKPLNKYEISGIIGSMKSW